LIEQLPSDELHLIPSFLPEVILSTKEVNEKTRQCAFNLLITIANRMQKGGSITMDVFEDATSENPKKGANPENNNTKGKKAGKKQANITEATLEEFVKMVIAGLAGTSPHMMSATVNFLTRLVFEFYGKFFKSLK